MTKQKSDFACPIEIAVTNSFNFHKNELYDGVYKLNGTKVWKAAELFPEKQIYFDKNEETWKIASKVDGKTVERFRFGNGSDPCPSSVLGLPEVIKVQCNFESIFLTVRQIQLQ